MLMVIMGAVVMMLMVVIITRSAAKATPLQEEGTLRSVWRTYYVRTCTEGFVRYSVLDLTLL